MSAETLVGSLVRGMKFSLAALSLFLSSVLHGGHGPVLASASTLARATPQQGDQAQALKVAELLRNGLPGGLLLFRIPDPSHNSLTIPRLAILNRNRLQIFRPDGKDLALDYTLDAPPGTSWEELATFPSSEDFPGIVIYWGEEAARDSAEVVCYVRGRFQVVFKGQNVRFTDLLTDGFPEILEEQYKDMDSASPESMKIWAWDGDKYALAIVVPDAAAWSKEVVEAVRRIAATRKGPRS